MGTIRKTHAATKIKLSGNQSAITALKEKLAQLRQNEKERVRGFDDGGSSVDNVEAEIAAIEQQVSELEKELEEINQELQDVVEEMTEFGKMQDLQREAEEACNRQDLENMADKYRECGIDCDVEVGNNGNFEIAVKNPGGFQGQNLLEMSPDDLTGLIREEGTSNTSETKSAGSMDLMPGDVMEDKASTSHVDNLKDVSNIETGGVSR